MKEPIKYTKPEIQSSINILNHRLDLLKLQRSEISRNINSVKKQIKKWKEIDLNQLKMF